MDILSFPFSTSVVSDNSSISSSARAPYAPRLTTWNSFGLYEVREKGSTARERPQTDANRSVLGPMDLVYAAETGFVPSLTMLTYRE